ncbi:hypothetical protein F5884DRAFT_61953 [Xylogone sp. PMI_703]|nr:hypothetical protein F5884DRAFT_61953 [Xylogone sp. PMI_703]
MVVASSPPVCFSTSSLGALQQSHSPNRLLSVHIHQRLHIPRARLRYREKGTTATRLVLDKPPSRHTHSDSWCLWTFRPGKHHPFACLLRFLPVRRHCILDARKALCESHKYRVAYKMHNYAIGTVCLVERLHDIDHAHESLHSENCLGGLKEEIQPAKSLVSLARCQWDGRVL